MTVWCYIHNDIEEQPEGSIQCFECKHVFLAPGNLVDDWNILQQMMVEESMKPDPFDGLVRPHLPRFIQDAAEVPFCPHCLHDF